MKSNSKQQSRGYGKEWRMNVTRVHRKAANLGVMRKESRGCVPEGAEAARFRMVQSDGDSKRPRYNLTPSWVPIATLYNLR